MKDILSVITSRRSVKSYLQEMPNSEDIEKIIYHYIVNLINKN